MQTAPSDWKWRRLKHVAVVNRATLPDDTDPDRVIAYIDIGSVDSFGRIGEPEKLAFGEAPSRARRLVLPGDSIISTVRTYLKAIAHIEGDAEELVVSTGFATVTPTSSVTPRFLYWWLRSEPTIDEVVARSMGVSYPAVGSDDIGNLAVPILPRDQQDRMVSLLDREIAQIDHARSELENQASLLFERRQALVTSVMLGYEGE